MNKPSPSEELLRQFLLGKVDSAQREHIESVFLTDSAFNDRLLAAEQALIDDYLEGRLERDNEASFLSQYGASPDQRRKLRIAKSVKEHAETHAGLRPVDVAPSLKQSRWSRPMLILPIAAVLIVVVVLALWLQTRKSQPQTQHLAMEKEIASLNEPAKLRETLAGTETLSVAPITLRTVQAQAQFTARPDVRVLELHVLLTTNEPHARYRAVLRKGSNSEQFGFPELSPPDDNPRIIRLRVPVSLLSPGDYRILLSTIAVDGTVSSVEEYNFVVRG